MIEAEIIKDSVNTRGDRITSWVLTYPRFVHSETLTHRVFSRNAASSRAIPVKKMLEAVINNPAMPEHWGTNQPGMQADEELSADAIEDCKREWLLSRDEAVVRVQRLSDLKLHKQVANRLLEPWAHMTTIVTATQFENFFALRANKAAQPEFRKLAYLMLPLYQASKPTLLQPGEWHIPFSDRMPELPFEEQIKVAVARVARVSYLTFDGEVDVAKDLALHDDLQRAGHWSPFEHIAYAAPGVGVVGNFHGWVQYRKQFPGENRKDPRIHPSPPPPR